MAPIAAAIAIAAPGALPKSLMVDETSLESLIAGTDVCGAVGDEQSCLRVVPCDELDDAEVACSAEDPVWMPDPKTSGAGGQKRSLFRVVLPLNAGPHANFGSIAKSAGRLVSAPHAFLLPRTLLLYARKEKAHDKACSARFCLIPDELLRTRGENVAFPASKAVVRALLAKPRRARKGRHGRPEAVRAKRQAWPP